jgi:hypothetical protein
MSVGKARSLSKSGALERCFTRVGSRVAEEKSFITLTPGLERRIKEYVLLRLKNFTNVFLMPLMVFLWHYKDECLAHASQFLRKRPGDIFTTLFSS